MNKFKLRRVTLSNFKAFRTKTVNIESDNLSLLDGPNGFGKTTFFDALELLLTGKVERYIRWDRTVENQRKNFGRHPLLFKDAKSNESLTVEVELTNSSETIIIKREASAAALNSNRRVSDGQFDLYKKSTNGWKLVENNKQFIENIFGDNFLKNYAVMHYIQQEDNTLILKSNHTDKQDKINHLFNVAEFQAKEDKIASAMRLLSKLRGRRVDDNINNLENQIIKEKQQLSSLPEPVEYKRLINIKELPWDSEQLSDNVSILRSWLTEDSELSRLRYLIARKQTFKDYRYNLKLKTELAIYNKKQGGDTDRALSPLLQFSHRLHLIPSLREQLNLLALAENYLVSISSGVIQAIENNKAIPNEKLFVEFLPKISLESFKVEIQTLSTLNSSSTQLEKTLNSIKSLHLELTKEHKVLIEQTNKEGEVCPTCGHPWESHKELILQFEKQQIKISDELNKISGDFSKKLDAINNNYIQPIKSNLLNFIESFKDRKAYIEEICALEDNQISYLHQLVNKYKQYDIDITEYAVEDFQLDVSDNLSQLKKTVNRLMRDIDYDLIEQDFDYLFQEVLSNSEQALDEITLHDLELKNSYIRYCYLLSQYKNLQVKEKELELQKKKLASVNTHYEQLKKLKNVYTSSIKKYITDVSQGIEILFHIYTGRLLQNYSQGLGLFIDHTGDSISFKEQSSSDIDALFSMSSGQLSALSIAFTLALNHKYAQNNLMLIDDPVQTMDEINMSAFIDLLRYEFKDRQILISTHEDHTSAYFRYKFLKAGLERGRINFMQQIRENN
ncbi:AAA family ATPase [Catenovulum adriaticum]|uniref:AAA family ATPase n=1 Tax=Catenovulum adriaticum TaxID=2984846 RepID=A0ABY7AR20_9ALTE|nr:AAA family ATPase [Catenovulum sp. TS8]WAJ71992.1 AAA family ATPase [Catenovulum sp. TS8]